MKHPKVIIAGAVLAITATGGLIAADNRDYPPITTQKTQSVNSEPETVASEVEVVNETSNVQPIATASTSSPEPTTATPQPAYGEDPNNPGVFIVFDKTAIMTAAGIPNSEQAAVDTLFSKFGWKYKGANEDINLCYITPARKMAISGEDYATNPVTQLIWCKQYLLARHGNWQGTLNFLQSNSRLY